MAFLNEADRMKIERAVEDAETKTTGEFVAVIAGESDDYFYIPTLIAAAVVFVLSGLALLIWPGGIAIDHFYAGQVAAFIALSLAFRWRPLKMRLIPRSVQGQRARRHAHQRFLDLGLSSTRNRTGVMLFVSLAERYVEIIVDRGIQQHVDNAVWRTIVDEFTSEVRAGRIADGVVKAVEACTAVMAEHHPWHPGDENELPNRLIIL